MLLKRIWSYLWGYCVIMVEGPRKERFINLAVTRGIYLWDIAQDGDSRLWVKVSIDGLRALRHIARISRCGFKITSKKGLPFLAKKAEKRKGLVVGTAIFLIALYWLSSYVWFVDVTSVKPFKHLTQEKVLSEAAQLGLKPGIHKSALDISSLEKQLGRSLPETTFISIDLKGTLVTIEIVEKTVITDNKNTKPAHIVAVKDGIIEEILVLTGDPRVEEGDTVQKGELLISGIVPPLLNQDGANLENSEEYLISKEPQIVRAHGIVRARVWYEAVAEAPLVDTGYLATGRKSTRVSLKIGNNQIVIRGPRKIPYEVYESETAERKISWGRNFTVPVEVIQDTYHEMTFYRNELGKDGAIEKAREEAIKGLNQEIAKQARILDQKVEAVQTEQGTVKVKVWVETLEDIGMEQDFE